MKQLRPYQQKAITEIDLALKRGVNNQLCVLFTGGGKTFLAVKMIEALGFKRVLWITHTQELIEQSALAFISDKFGDKVANEVEKVEFLNWVKLGRSFEDGYKIGCIKADLFDIDADIVMASAQTLYKRLDKIDVDRFDCIITDESHLFLSKTFSEPLRYFKPKLLLGLTATPTRADGVQMSDIYDEMVFEYNIGDGVRDGWLCELNGIRVKTNVSLDNIHTLGGDLNQKELANEVNCYSRNKLIVDKYLEYAKGRQGIFFCVDIQHCLDLLEVFLEAGISADAVSSNEELTGDRNDKVRRFKRGEIDVLMNVNILTTGFNHPDVGVIGQCCPTKSLTKWLQSTGRGSRLKTDKYVEKFGQNCVILDFVDNTSKHSLVNAWNLDKSLPLEQRVYVTKENKDKILEARRAKIEGNVLKDEVIQLLPLKEKPKLMSDRLKELATEAQVKFLNDLGYPVNDTVYTKAMAQEVLDMLPARKIDIEELARLGFDVSQPITRGQASYNIWNFKIKNKTWNK